MRWAARFQAHANDYLYRWDFSRDYNASPRLERSKARLASNAADDERNLPETGSMERELKRIPGARVI